MTSFLLSERTDSKDQMQYAGGILLIAGWTAMTP